MNSNIVETFREYINSRLNCYKMTKANLPVRAELVNACEYLEKFVGGNGWISVSDDNPTTNDYVFVLLHGKFPALGKYDNEIWEVQALGSQYLNLVDGSCVTHWKPAPQLPKE